MFLDHIAKGPKIAFSSTFGGLGAYIVWPHVQLAHLFGNENVSRPLL